MRAYLYDASGADRECELSEIDPEALSAAHLLWVDVDPEAENEITDAANTLGLDEADIAALTDNSQDPSLVLHKDYFHVAVTAVEKEDEGYKATQLDCLAGRNWVLTSHRGPLEFLDRFDDRFRGDSNVGQLGSATFVSALLGELLRSYDEQNILIVNEIDRVDQLILRDRVDERRMLHELTAINQRAVRLRRWLVPHREIFERLTQPDFSELLPSDSRDGIYGPLVDRLMRTLDALDATRQMVASSLNLYTTLVAHGTNKVIKLLTVVSVALLPPTLLTGFLGMNSLPNAFRTPTAFWISFGAILSLMTVTLVVARRQDWI